MAALTAARNTPRTNLPEAIPSSIDAPLKANAKVYQGSLIAIDSSGYFVDPTAVTALIVAGVCHPTNPTTNVADNTAAGAVNGGVIAKAEQGVHRFDSGTAGDVITVADRYKLCWLIDDHTVGRLDGGATPRSVAGIVWDVDSSGVHVLLCVAITAAVLAATNATRGTPPDTISAAGALSTTNEWTLASVTGTTAYTLADGTFLGQRKRITVIAGASTPNATVTPATPRGYATVSALGAIGDFVEFVWTATGWILGPSQGVTIA